MNKKILNPVRTLSGVTPVTILTKPYPCPGRCVYCPNEKGMPKSYLAKEPAAARAKLSNFDAKTQVEYRLRQYRNTNHPTDKVELIILGGTWSYYSEEYRDQFIKDCYDTLNGEISETLLEAQLKNEKSKQRMIGLTIETRPDFVNEKEIKKLREYGVTRVELGVQSVFDKVLEKNLRDHKVQKTTEATKLLKESGFKINYHMMPGLPGSNFEKDVEMFRILFNDMRFQPDMLKIYPCLIFEKTLAYEWFQEGKYIPYKTEDLVQLGLDIKKEIPEYVRIMRFYRDIPKEYILGGSISSNLRQMIHKEMEKNGQKCSCIRCREIRNQIREKNLTMKRIDYLASNGQEVFLQFVDNQNRIYGFLRLRKNDENSKLIFETLKGTALIRELHVYGRSIPISEKGKVQHQGLGLKLVKEAEEIANKEWGLKKIGVISGVGVRDYYRKMDYKLEETYMVKEF